MSTSTPWLWQAAAALAGRLHRGQTRRDERTPYVTHTFRVCLTLRHLFCCEDEHVLAAALLHDTIEDTTADYDELVDALTDAGVAAGVDAAAARAVANDVARLVAAMTKDMRLPETEREHAYDEQLARADARARLIKLADTYDNLCDALAEPGGAASAGSSIAKARRALALAARDDHAASARARAVLGALVDRVTR